MTKPNIKLSDLILSDGLSNRIRWYRFRRQATLRNRLIAWSSFLTDCEKLTLILDPLLDGLSTNRIVEVLLQELRTFEAVINAPASKLMGVDGISRAVAAALRSLRDGTGGKPQQSTCNRQITLKDAENYLVSWLQQDFIEILGVLYFDNNNNFIVAEQEFQILVGGVPNYHRRVVRRCLELDASSILIAHNRPNDNLHIMHEDIKIAENIVNAAALFGVTVIDHLIVGRSESLSMRERGLI